MRVKSQESVGEDFFSPLIRSLGCYSRLSSHGRVGERKSSGAAGHMEDLVRQGDGSAFYLLKHAALTAKTDRQAVNTDGFFSILWIFSPPPTPSHFISPSALSIFSVTGGGEIHKATSLPFQVLSKLWP